jgi:hypothetical protein
VTWKCPYRIKGTPEGSALEKTEDCFCIRRGSGEGGEQSGCPRRELRGGDSMGEKPGEDKEEAGRLLRFIKEMEAEEGHFSEKWKYWGG